MVNTNAGINLKLKKTNYIQIFKKADKLLKMLELAEIIFSVKPICCTCKT